MKYVDHYGRPYIATVVPMPDHDSISVGKIDVNSSEDLKKAMQMFISQGGEIRKYKDMVAINLLEDVNPLTIKEATEEEVQDEVFGKVRLK